MQEARSSICLPASQGLFCCHPLWPMTGSSEHSTQHFIQRQGSLPLMLHLLLLDMLHHAKDAIHGLRRPNKWCCSERDPLRCSRDQLSVIIVSALNALRRNAAGSLSVGSIPYLTTHYHSMLPDTHPMTAVQECPSYGSDSTCVTSVADILLRWVRLTLSQGTYGAARQLHQGCNVKCAHADLLSLTSLF